MDLTGRVYGESVFQVHGHDDGEEDHRREGAEGEEVTLPELQQKAIDTIAEELANPHADTLKGTLALEVLELTLPYIGYKLPPSQEQSSTV